MFKEPRRHCEPTGRPNARPMTGSAKIPQSNQKESMDCFVASLLAIVVASNNVGYPSQS
jgi:hypothetical protein